MSTYLLVRYAHFISILILVGVVLGQYYLVRRRMSRKEIAGLQRLDIVYAVGAVAVLATGFLMWFGLGKGADFYSKNGIFHTKVFLFLVIGLLSIYPSIFFGRQKKGDVDDEVVVPGAVIWSIRLEVLLLLLMPLLATLMAHGIGLSLE